MRALRLSVVVVVVVSAAAFLLPVFAQSPAVGRRVKATALATDARVSSQTSAAELRQWDAIVTAWTQTGDLVPVSVDVDLKVPGRTIERWAQRHHGVAVFGADVVRQINANGVSESIFGALYPNIDIDVTPALPADRAALALAGMTKSVLAPGEVPELQILATTVGYRLTWTARVISPFTSLVRRVFVDANTGTLVWWYEDAWTQVAIPPNGATGEGTGVVGDRLKLPVERMAGGFRAVDVFRPGNNTTYDMKANPVRASQVLSGQVSLVDNDIAITTRNDNIWTDPAVVSTHAYAGLSYSFFHDRFERRGLNNNDIRFRLVVNPVRAQDFATQGGQFPLFFNNAAYFGGGFVGFGVGSILPNGVTNLRNFGGALDIVGHELAHGVTRFTSNLIYQNESGALNEAFSDIMGVAIEFTYQAFGAGSGFADWEQGEDARTNGIVGLRSFSNPAQRGHPDHYSIRFTGTSDNGGVHINSSIVNHMVFLAVMGGTHRLSGLRVDGVGFSNRHQIEDIVYRAFTQLLPANASFSVARAATIQAARDLFGVGSAAEQAIIQAWNAVGVE
jgi:thermolysin